MKSLSGLGAFSSVLALSMLVAFSAVGFAETRVGGTKGNDWGSPSYPNWNLPHDCPTHQQRGALFGTTTGAGHERIWGNEGCDLIAAGKGNDTVYGGKEMDALYGGLGNDKLKGDKGHDHLFGGSGAGISSGNDLLDTRDGENERGELEEVHGADGLDRCFLDPDPDGVKFSGCEYLNGRKSPYPTEKYFNTSEEGNQAERRAEVNQFLRGK
jgi:RTX calcium-binding nonapeptide repeat (4 copies)